MCCLIFGVLSLDSIARNILIRPFAVMSHLQPRFACNIPDYIVLQASVEPQARLSPPRRGLPCTMYIYQFLDKCTQCGYFPWRWCVRRFTSNRSLYPSISSTSPQCQHRLMVRGIQALITITRQMQALGSRTTVRDRCFTANPARGPDQQCNAIC